MPELADILLTLVTLIFLEVILGVDNLIFLTILSGRLPEAQQKLARRIVLMLAWVTRLLLLAFAVYLTKLVAPLFSVFSHAFSIRDLFLLCGGLFLLITASQEIYHKRKGVAKQRPVKSFGDKFTWIVIQIALFDIIFSLDSVLTAIGLTQQFWLMAIAITVSIVSMMIASEPLSACIKRHPLLNMLALVALLLIGMVLMSHGLGVTFFV